MPAGKLGPSGGYGWATQLPYSVSIRALRKAKPGGPPLTKPELRKLRRILRDSVTIYQIAIQMPVTTATERRRIFGRIRTNTSHFLTAPTQEHAERLLESLDAADPNTRAVLHRELGTRGFHATALPRLKRQLGTLFFFTAYPDEPPPQVGRPSRAQLDRARTFCIEYGPVLLALADIDVRALSPRSGKWANPAQANLIAALEQVWCRVTGRTSGLTSVNVMGEKQCLYADWLGQVLAKIDLPSPAVGSVVDVVRDNTREKNPAP